MYDNGHLIFRSMHDDHSTLVTMACLQNQVGPHPLKWDKTGRVIEVRQFDQYVVRVDGSGRVTLRNRSSSANTSRCRHRTQNLPLVLTWAS